MAIYRQGKKVTGIYKNGKAVTGIYRDGKKVWDKGTPRQVYALMVEPVSVSDDLYIQHAIKHISPQQTLYYLDVPLGSKTVRLAGNAIGVVKGKLINGYLTWEDVRLTDEDVWVGKEPEVKLAMSPVTVDATRVTWESENKGVFEFESVSFNPDTRISLYKYGAKTGIELYSYNVWVNDTLVRQAQGQWSIENQMINRLNIGLGNDLSVLQGEKNVRVEIENAGLRTGCKKNMSCGLFLTTPAKKITNVKLKIKGLIR